MEIGSVDTTQALAGGTFFVGTGTAKLISGGACFVAGTVVLTSLGLKNIEDVASATSSIAKDGTQLCDKVGYDKYFQLVEIEKRN